MVFGSSGKHAYVSFTYGSCEEYLLLLTTFASSLLLHLHVLCIFSINCFISFILEVLLLIFYGFLSIDLDLSAAHE